MRDSAPACRDPFCSTPPRDPDPGRLARAQHQSRMHVKARWREANGLKAAESADDRYSSKSPLLRGFRSKGHGHEGKRHEFSANVSVVFFFIDPPFECVCMATQRSFLNV